MTSPANRAGGGFEPPPPTPPDMQLRIRRFLTVPKDEAALLDFLQIVQPAENLRPFQSAVGAALEDQRHH
jgi:hypothetical protein